MRFFRMISTVVMLPLLPLLLILLILLQTALLVGAYAAETVRLPVAVTNTSGTSQVNQTIKLALNNTDTPFFDWGNNCNDVRIEDDSGNVLDFFIESCDTVAQQGIVWFRLPFIAASSAPVNLLLIYGDSTASSASNGNATFTLTGFKYHTQPFTGAAPGPESRSEGEAIFNFDKVTGTSGYGCQTVASIDRDNSGTFGSNANIGYYVESYFTIPTAATYEFRYGMDFGNGGELYINGVTVEADWTNDLWWGFNFANTDVLTGSIFLTPGTHTFKVLGFEGCCDGPAAIEYRTSPTAAWRSFDTSATPIQFRAASCPVVDSTILTTQVQTGVELSINKSSSDDAPPLGSTITFFIEIENLGRLDATNVNISDSLPAGFASVSSISDSGTIDAANNLSWVIPVIASGTSKTVQFNAVVQ